MDFMLLWYLFKLCNPPSFGQIIGVISVFDAKKALDEMDGTEIMGKRVQVSKSTNVSSVSFYGLLI